MLYDVSFLISGPDKNGFCLFLNPNKKIGDPDYHFLIHETALPPENSTLLLTKSQLDSLLSTPDNDLPFFDLVIKKAWQEYGLCSKCKPRRKPRRRSRTTITLVNSERKTERG